MIKEFLADCAQIPYNSAKRDLPSSYSEPVWGYDCVGFVQMATDALPDTDIIRGWYGGNIHVAALSQGVAYVDPYLRMLDALDIRSGKTAPTYHRGTVVSCRYDPDASMLDVKQTKCQLYQLNAYTFYLGKQDIEDPPPGGYMYAFLHDGNQIVCKPAKVRGQHVIKVGGAEPEDADGILRERFGINLGDINEMFHQAIQNKQYYNYWDTHQ